MFTRFFTALAFALPFAIPALTAEAQEITIGGKAYTEQLLMTEMTAQLLEGNGYEVERAGGTGTAVVRAAQENAQVDLYWEYTGTSLIVFNKVKEKLTAEETYNRVKELDMQKGIVWLNPSRANNTYALAMRKGDSAEKGITTLSEMAQSYNDGENLSMGVNAEFPKRQDGLLGLQETYDFQAGRANLVPMDTGLTYQALRDGEVDIGLVFATDGRIAAFDFLVLEDDRGFFPAYAMTPVVRQDTLDANPELAPLLNALSSKLDDATMQGLNSRIDVDKETVEAVAESFLKQHGLIN